METYYIVQNIFIQWPFLNYFEGFIYQSASSVVIFYFSQSPFLHLILSKWFSFAVEILALLSY